MNPSRHFIRYRSHAREAVTPDGKPTQDIINPLVVTRRLLSADRVDHWRTAQLADSILNKMLNAHGLAYQRAQKRYANQEEIPKEEELGVFLQYLDVGTIELTAEEYNLLATVLDDAGKMDKFTRYPASCFGPLELRHYLPVFQDLNAAGPHPKDPPEVPDNVQDGR